MQSKSHYSDYDDDDDYDNDDDILFTLFCQGFWWSLCNIVIMNIKNEQNNEI